MKKITALLCSFLMALSVASCGTPEGANTSSAASNSAFDSVSSNSGNDLPRTEKETFEEFLASTKTDSFLIMQNGEEIFSFYSSDGKKTEKANVYSAGKSFSSILFGIAMEQGYFSIDDPITEYITDEFEGVDRAELEKITVKHLLTMTSGFDDLLKHSTSAGEKWKYSDAWNLLFTILEKTTGKSVNEYARENLFSKLGMDNAEYRSSKIVLRLLRKGTPSLESWNPQQLHCTAEDFAKFGELIRNNGVVNGERLISEKYLEAALTECDQNPAYGYLFWLNENDGGLAPNEDAPLTENIIPNAPRDTICALGADDKKLYIVPSMNLVAVRIGGRGTSDRNAFTEYDNELWGYINEYLRAH